MAGAGAARGDRRARPPALEGRGRVLVRPSGTEQLVRVMVEAPTERGDRRRLRAARRDRRARRPLHGRPSRVSAGEGSPRPSPRPRSPPCAASSDTSDSARSRSSSSPGLEKLEYRGYDSAGRLGPRRRRDRLGARGRQPEQAARAARRARRRRPAPAPSRRRAPATTGIGHTRWATHGRVTEANAHPHFDTTDRVHVVVNGIVENYLELQRAADGRWAPTSPPRPTPRSSRTSIAHHMARGGLVEAVRAAYAELEGHYAFVAMSRRRARHARRRPQGVPAGRRPRRRRAVPRLGDPRLPAHTRDVQFIENDEIVVLTRRRRRRS